VVWREKWEAKKRVENERKDRDQEKEWWEVKGREPSLIRLLTNSLDLPVDVWSTVWLNFLPLFCQS